MSLRGCSTPSGYSIEFEVVTVTVYPAQFDLCTLTDCPIEWTGYPTQFNVGKLKCCPTEFEGDTLNGCLRKFELRTLTNCSTEYLNLYRKRKNVHKIAYW